MMFMDAGIMKHQNTINVFSDIKIGLSRLVM